MSLARRVPDALEKSASLCRALGRPHNGPMPLAIPTRLTLRQGLPTPVSGVFLHHCQQALDRVVMPSAHLHVVVRDGSGGVEAYAMGARPRAHRKRIQAGQRTLFVRLAPGASRRLLGVAPRDLLGRVVALDTLWGSAACDRLLGQLEGLPTPEAAVRVLGEALAERGACVRAAERQPLIHAAMESLPYQDVASVARTLGVSERHLRRIFQDEIGLNPKAYARLQRFKQAVSSAIGSPKAHWAAIAADAGYCDQAHLIAEFRAIAGVTPRRFMQELAQAEDVSEGLGMPG